MAILARMLRHRGGSSAVEFAIIAPIFLLVLLTMIGYGIYLMTAHSVQQVAADAARTAVAGLNNNERQALAKDFVTRTSLGYVFMDKRYFNVTVGQDLNNSNQFTVTVEYDATELPIWNLYSYALPEKTIKRFSTIRIGGV